MNFLDKGAIIFGGSSKKEINMRWLRMIGFSILVLAAAGTVTAKETAEKTPSAGPLAVVDKSEYTFSSVIEGTEVKHDFIIRNTGDAPLLIENVKGG